MMLTELRHLRRGDDLPVRALSARLKKLERTIRVFITTKTLTEAQRGCPGRIPHDFRRTAVRNLVRSGVPEAVAMTITGAQDAGGVRRVQHRERW